MPIYTFRCVGNHEWDELRAMKDARLGSQCEICDSPGERVIFPSTAKTGFDEHTRKLLSVPFGKKKASKFQNAKDVDRALSDFYRRYPTLQREN